MRNVVSREHMPVDIGKRLHALWGFEHGLLARRFGIVEIAGNEGASCTLPARQLADIFNSRQAARAVAHSPGRRNS